MFRCLVVATAGLALAGCLRDVGSGPELGDCADVPDGSYTYGEAGIGTCVSGPTDIRFAELGGKTYLIVANGDPYLNFATGSVLLIDWDSVDTTARETTFDSLNAAAVATDRFLGGIGLVDDRPDGTPLLLVASRYSEGATTTSFRDDVLVIDVSDPAAPSMFADGPRLTVEDDPYHIAVVGKRAYVLNLTDHSVSVIDTHATPLRVVDIAGSPRVGPETFYDEDDSGSAAALASAQVAFPDLVLDDTWTLSWIDTTWRVWLPTEGDLQRYQVGNGTVVAAPTGPDIDGSTFVGSLTSPFAFLSGEGLPSLAFGNGGDIYTATNSGSISAWFVSATPLLRSNPEGGFDAYLDSPCFFNGETGLTAAFEAISADDGQSRIALAFSDDGVTYTRAAEPAIEGPAGVSYGDPFVRGDSFTGSLRMWMSVDDGTGWSIAESASGAGSVWAAPTGVTGLPESAAGPTVTFQDGRYHLWFSTWDGDSWNLARAWSVDGSDWQDVEIVRDHVQATDFADPPRAALQPVSGGGFSVSARDSGAFTSLAVDGQLFTSALGTAGITFQVTTGFELEGASVDEDLGANGIEPGSATRIDGTAHLFVTVSGADGQRRVAQVRRTDSGWETVTADVFAGTDVEQSFDPVVSGADGAWNLWFGTSDTDGRLVVRRATSPDGINWALQDGIVFSTEVGWAEQGVRPGSVQFLTDGRARLWFTANDGDTLRVGSAVSDDGGATFTLEPGAGGDDWQFEPGVPGTFDDSGVADPRVFEDDGVTYLAYAGFDGDRWRLGLATLDADADATGPWARRVDPAGARSPWLPLLSGTFAASGVIQPVPLVRDDGVLEVFYAGQDQEDVQISRLGRAVGSPAAIFPALAFPTFDDTLMFRTLGGSDGRSSIELAQTVDSFSTNGQGGSNLRYDEERGFLYVTSKLANHVYVIDVRDDSTRTELDGNWLDLEGLIRVRTQNGATGMRDILPVPGTDLLYATTRRPDGVVVLDASDVVDDSTKQVHEDAAVGTLPLRTANYDAGVDSFTNAGLATGAGMAIRDRGGRRHLFVTHFRDNSLTIFDLDRGPTGEEVAYLPFIGENPHLVRISPDGRFAVVANYLGNVEDGAVSSTLAVVDADPDSPTFGTVLTTLVNK